MKRIFNSYRMLKYTANMSYDEKAQAIEYIQNTLGSSSGTPLSCMCRDKVKYAEQLRDEGVLGASDDIYTSKLQNSEPSVLGIMVNGVDYDFSAIDDIWGLNLRANKELRTKYCTDLIEEERLKKYNADDVDTCVDKLGDTFLSAKQTCGPLRPINETEHYKCLKCTWLDSGAWTAIGCIHSDFSKTVERLFTIALGFGGLSALGCIIYASFLMQTSAGNPEKTKKAQELITSCIAGLILIIFSVFILRVLGVDILRIPGFS